MKSYRWLALASTACAVVYVSTGGVVAELFRFYTIGFGVITVLDVLYVTLRDHKWPKPPRHAG